MLSKITVGSGSVDTAHGRLSVPAPATRVMLSGFRQLKLDTGTEILTPTGAAILTACGQQVSERPKGRLLGDGYGCGQKQIPTCSDYLRVLHLSDGQDPQA